MGSEGKGKAAHKPKAHTAGAYTSFLASLGVKLPPLDRMLVHHRLYPPAVCCQYPFIYLGEETKWSKVHGLRNNVTGEA